MKATETRTESWKVATFGDQIEVIIDGTKSVCVMARGAAKYAPLIAAAPDLLAAAQQAMRVWPDQLRGSTLEEAIRKATT